MTVSERLEATAELDRWRAQILQWILLISTVLSLPPYGFAIQIAVEDGDFIPLGLSHVVGFFLLASITAMGRLPFRARAGILVGIFVLAGGTILARYGPISGGRLLFFAAVAQAAVFFGFRTAAYVLALTMAILSLVAAGFITGYFPETGQSFSHGWISWATAGMTYLFLAGGVVASVGFITQKLEESWCTCRELLREVRSLNEELEERVRLRTARLAAVNSELEAFAYSVSHDLRTPLRAIHGFSRALEEEYHSKLDETGKDYLERVIRASGRMDTLIDDLLELSRVTRSPLERAEIDLSQIARDIGEELRRGNPSREVSFDVESEVKASGDERLVRIVLQSLLENAWKFTSRCDDPAVAFGRIDVDGATGFRVCDNGIGFDMNYAGRLFMPFERLHSDNDFEGTGIGLATAQRVVAMHSGRIWAEGAPDGGATFTFTLPS